VVNKNGSYRKRKSDLIMRKVKTVSLKPKVKAYLESIFHTYKFSNFSLALNSLISIILENKDIRERIEKELKKMGN